MVIGRNIVESWRQPKQASTILQDREAESITMLRAIPDSMLCVSQNGICLSYMPAQEATSFTLYGDIVNKHIDEFLAPKIARQFTTSIESSLQTGLTKDCSFSISAEDEEQHFEARVNPIGQSEVLILVREIHNSNFSSGIAQHSVSGDNKTIPVFTESEFTQVLEKKLPNSNERNFILLCLTIYAETKNTVVSPVDNTDVVTIDGNLISQVIATVHSLIPSSIIARFDDNDLIILVGDRTIETSSTMVDELHQKIEELLFAWQNDFCSINFKIALLEINSDSSDVKASIDAAKTACRMAKQKINLKTF